MFKYLMKVMSDICTILGFQRRALWFLAMAIEDKNLVSPVIHLNNTPSKPRPVLPKGPFEIKVLFEDKDYIKAQNIILTDDVKIAKHLNEMN